MTAWHAAEIEKTLELLGSGKNGLTTQEATARLEEHGFNEIPEKKGKTAWTLLLQQFKNFLIILLLAAAMISLGIGLMESSFQEVIEAGLIILIVLFIVLVGFYQEYHAQEELAALKRMLTLEAVVLRDGEPRQVPAREVVPGDVMLIEAGDRVPADGRLISNIDLQVNESVLTGEAVPVEKTLNALDENLTIGDRINMIFTGTTVTLGKGAAVAVATGSQSEFGRIAQQMQEIEEKRTPLQDRLDLLGRQIGLGVVFLCAFIFVVGALLRDTPPIEMFLVAVALAVAAVPEGLPGVVTMALAVGTRRMVKRNVIVRTMPSVETLGCTTVICSDKTGTITHNQMTVKKIYLGGRTIDVTGDGYRPEGGFSLDGAALDPGQDDALTLLLKAAALCNNAGLRQAEGEWQALGDPTETSLLAAAAKAGLNLDDLKKESPRVGEIPFSSERKRMATVHEEAGAYTVYLKGAPDILLNLCSQVRTPDGPAGMDAEARAEIAEANDRLAREAYRVLAVAYRRLEKIPEAGEAESEAVFIGLLGIQDPPRSDAREAIQKCHAAGIRTIMITGDHQATALAIGREVGIGQGEPNILTGEKLARMSDAELGEVVEDVHIFARVSPEHKLRIVAALQEKGHVVAMTGDGVNDAPALKKADIGVAMGITGTDVSKEAADMVLLDDNFASIVGAVEEGRGIYDNIRKIFGYLMSGNIVEVVIIFLTSVWGSVPIAMTATQILIINLLTDGFPALALGVDPFEPGAMNRPPRSRYEPLYKGLAPFLIYYPIIVSAVALGLFFWIYDPALKNGFEAQTVAFLTVALSESYQALASRSTRISVFKAGLFANRWLWLTVGGAFFLILLLIYVPMSMPFGDGSLQEAMHFAPLPFFEFLLVLVLSALGFVYLEIAKTVISRKRASNGADEARH